MTSVALKNIYINFCFGSFLDKTLLFSAAGSVDTSGTVDGLNTLETISLDEVQHLGGLTTFTQLEVTETLDVSDFLLSVIYSHSSIVFSFRSTEPSTGNIYLTSNQI